MEVSQPIDNDLTTAAAIEATPPRRAANRSLRWICTGVAAAGCFGIVVMLSRSGAGHAKPTHALAVLPLQNLNLPKTDAFLSSGVTGDLTNRFAASPGLRVVARTSADLFRNVGSDVRSIGQKLRATEILEGSIAETSDGQLEINARLVDAANGYLLWAQTFRCDRSRILVAEDRIVDGASRALGIRRSSARYAPKNNAFDLYLRGRYSWDHADLDQALNLMRQAVAADPDYAVAQAGLADAYSTLAALDFRKPQDVLPEAERAARRAVALDPSSGRGYAALGYVHYCQWKWAEADQEFRRATQLSPNDSYAWHEWAYVDFAYGRFDDAEQALRRGELLDPASLWNTNTLLMIYYYRRSYEQAMAESRRVLQIDPKDYVARLVLADSLVQIGKPAEAITAWKPMLDFTPNDKSAAFRMAFYQAANGNPGPLKVIVAEHEKSPWSSSFWIQAQSYIRLGNRSAAMRLLNRAADVRDSDLVSVRWDPAFDSIRNQPEYYRLLQKLGFE